MKDPDLDTRAAVYELTRLAWHRIEPQISGDIQCDFMVTYLLDCIASDRDPSTSPYGVYSVFEAATELGACLKEWRSRGQAQAIAKAAAGLERLFRGASPQGRDRIQTAALEHVLEDPGLRPVFSHWAADPELATAHAEALEWGQAHEQR